MLSAWQEMAKVGDLLAMFDKITAQTRYYLHLEDISKMPEEEAVERADNVQELRGLLQYAMEYEQPAASNFSPSSRWWLMSIASKTTPMP